MRIVFVVTRADEIGGAQIHVRDLACRLSQDGCDVTILSGPEIDRNYLTELQYCGVEYIAVNCLRRDIAFINDVRSTIEIWRYLTKLRPHLVSLHSSKAGIIGRIAGYLSGRKTLFTAHGWSFSEGVEWKKAALYRAVEKFSALLAARIVTVSYYDKNLAVRYRVVKSKRVEVIHNGVKDISEDSKAHLKYKECRIVMTARFAPPKDHDSLLHVLKDLESLDWTLDLVGDGPRLQSVKNLAMSLGLRQRVRFHGQINNVEQVLREASIFVLVTNWEGLPRSILEALRAGLPVVASKVGGIPEIVHQGINGFLVPRNNGCVLKEKLSDLITNSSLRISMGRQSREIYECEYTFERMYSRTRQMYNELTGIDTTCA